MEIEPIAFFRSPFATKFGIPKQSGLADTLRGTIEFVPKYRNADALRGMEDFRMLIYSIVLILVMLATNAPSMKAFFSRVQAAFGKKSHEGGKGNAV